MGSPFLFRTMSTCNNVFSSISFMISTNTEILEYFMSMRYLLLPSFCVKIAFSHLKMALTIRTQFSFFSVQGGGFIFYFFLLFLRALNANFIFANLQMVYLWFEGMRKQHEIKTAIKNASKKKKQQPRSTNSCGRTKREKLRRNKKTTTHTHRIIPYANGDCCNKEMTLVHVFS